MFCKRWKPEELLPKAELLAHILQSDPRIVGVALTGSLARLEPKIHDIDLVVFHDGSMHDGMAEDPERAEPYYSDTISLSTMLSTQLSRSLSQARNNTPANLIFVQEKAMWDCGYLRSLSKKEKFTEFYLRIFCDIPLILLDITNCSCGALLQHPWCTGTISIKGLTHLGVYVKHHCYDNSNSCLPKQKWAECRKEIKQRKNHWWHPFS